MDKTTYPSTSNVTGYVHKSQPDYIVIDSQKSLAIPTIMLALGVLGNGLAVASLLAYKYRTVSSCYNRSYSSVGNQSPNRNGNEQLQRSDETVQRTRSSLRKRSDAPRNERRRNAFGPFHTLVLALISLDLVGSLATSPVTLYLYSTNTTILPAGGKSLCNYSAFAMMFLGLVSMASLTAMAVERVISIQFPYFYDKHVTSKTALIAVNAIIISCAVFSMLPMIGFGKTRPMFPYTWCFADWQADKPKDMVFNYIYAVSGLVMILATLVCNVTVVVGLFKMKGRTMSSQHQRGKMRRETQMILQLIVMTVIYLICWLPLMIRIFDNQLTRKTHVKQDRIAIWLAAANPILDPWVYILLRRSVVKRLVKFVKSLCFTRVQNKLRLGANHVPPSSQLSLKEREHLATVAGYRPPCNGQPRSSGLSLDTVKESRELSSSVPSLYDNASLSKSNEQIPFIPTGDER